MANPEPQEIKTRVLADQTKIYRGLDKAIEYLTEVQATMPADTKLKERWLDYQTMELNFVYGRMETAEEAETRYQRELGAEEQARLAAKAAKEREQRYKAYLTLKAEFEG
jgi:hypothetical protein